MTLSKAIIKNIDTGEQIEVMYNPDQYTSSSQILYSGRAGTLQFDRLERLPFTVKLFFDTYEKGTDVRALIKPIAALQRPTVGQGEKRRPPLCLFSWGGFSYQGIVSQLDQHFTMFLSTGTPVRADLTVTFQEQLLPSGVEKDAGLDNCPKLHLVKVGERLDAIAARELGDARAWLWIARANNIDDPLRFPMPEQIGTLLAIPDAADLPKSDALSQGGNAAGADR